MLVYLYFFNLFIINRKRITIKTILKAKICFQRIFSVFMFFEQGDTVPIVWFPTVQSFLLGLTLAFAVAVS